MEKAIDSSAANRTLAAPRDLRQTQLAIGLFVAYVLFDWMTGHFPGRFGITPFNPHAALAIALLMFCGLKYLPLVVVAVALNEFAFVTVPRSHALAVITTLLLATGYAAVAALLTNRMRIGLDLDTRRDIVRFIGVTLVCMLLCGIAYVGMLMYFGIGGQGGSYFRGARRFFIGYSVGILIAMPVVLMAFSAKRRRQFGAFLRSGEGWLQVTAIIACISWVFLQEEPTHVQNFYLLFLPLIWAATRFGLVGAALALTMMQIGLFVLFYFTGYKPMSVFELQLLMITLSVTGLLLGVTIDEQRRAAKDFRESLKLAAAGEMAAAIAHEINQPLTALSSYATAGQLIATSPDLDRAQLTRTMEKLLAETRRTAAVVQRLRDFFRAGATRLERIVMSDLVAKVVSSLRAKAEVGQVTLTYPINTDMPLVLADTLQIEVVLRNLITNAIESAVNVGVNQGRVDVVVKSNNSGEVVVSVYDNGAGVREADLERLFESFVTTKTTGMGMGLAISRAIVDAHGGRIWAVPGTTGLLCFALPFGEKTIN